MLNIGVIARVITMHRIKEAFFAVLVLLCMPFYTSKSLYEGYDDFGLNTFLS